MTLSKSYPTRPRASIALLLPIGNLTPALRPGEKESIHQARLLLEKNKTRDVVGYWCPQCNHYFEPKTFLLPVQATQSWDGKRTVLTPRSLSPQSAMAPRFRKKASVSLSIILGSLMAGHTDRFFDVLARWPEILHEREIWKRTVGLWHRQKFLDTPDGKQAQKNLRKVGRRLGVKPVGRKELLTNAERARNKKESGRKLSKEFRAREKAKKHKLVGST